MKNGVSNQTFPQPNIHGATTQMEKLAQLVAQEGELLGDMKVATIKASPREKSRLVCESRGTLWVHIVN